MTIQKTHPITGDPLHPLGFTKKGRPIWPIMGGSGEGEGGSSGGTGGDSGGNTGSGSEKGAEGGGKTFTQEDMDRLVETRLARERARFADYDTLKERARKADELEAATASDMEKAVKTARTEAATEVTQKFQGILRGAEVRAQAAALKFRNPTTALAMLREKGVLDSIKVDENGTVEAGAVERELKALAESDPYLLVQDEKKPPASPADAGIGSGSSEGRTKPDLSPGVGRMRHAYGASGTTKN